MREPVNFRRIIPASLGALLMIPAGLAGVLAGVRELSETPADIAQTLQAIQLAAASTEPWCRPIACLLLGLALMVLAAGLLARGLQSSVR